MRILIVYATTEGQTRKVARHVLDRLAGAGHAVELIAAEEARGLDAAGCDAAVVAGSVHGGRYQKELVAWAKAEAPQLARVPTLFLSISLTAADKDPQEWDGLRGCVARFADETGWTPGRVEHVAGAFRFSEYDFFKSWAMRWIASQRDETVTASEDREYTDWAALETVLEDWTGGLATGR
jgi:menaquinone-dependent protoporphyrinogen oxidase